MTVIINGKTAVHKASGGTLTTQDICLTGENKTPITYINIAKSTDADKTAKSVFINGNSICHKKSIFAKSSGDEAGDQKGQKSGTIQGKAEFISGSTNVFIEGIQAVRQGDLMVANNNNTPPAQLQQPGAEISFNRINSIRQKLLTPKGPNQINIDTNGINFSAIPGIIIADSELYNIPIAEDAVHNSVLRRLEIHNLEDNKSYNLYLIIQSIKGNAIKISLGTNIKTTNSKERQPEIGAAENQLVTVNIRRQTDANEATNIKLLPQGIRELVEEEINNRKPNDNLPKQWIEMITPALRSIVKQNLNPQYASFLPPGFLYIYKNNYLWREFAIKEFSQLWEIDLEANAGNDERSASGIATEYITLAYKIQNRINNFTVAFSEKQWSWNDIENQQHHKEQLDLAPFIAPNATINQTTSKTGEKINMRLLNNNMIPTVFISDLP